MTTDAAPSHSRPCHGSRPAGPASRPINRRVVMRATAGLAAIAAAGGVGAPAAAQDAPERVTRAGEWDALAQGGVGVDTGGWQVFSSDFPFYAIGASWLVEVGLWPVIEVQLSADGVTWSETYRLTASNDAGGGPDLAQERLYTPLIHTTGTSHIQFRTVDSDENPGEVAGLRFTYIDATDGPWQEDIETAVGASTVDIAGIDPRTPPEIVTRAQWGANEGYRFNSVGVLWRPQYEPVHHILVHHTATPSDGDIPTAVRSIYYFHAVIQGWGDIGYNYLVGPDGRIYEGRYGGENVVGGHSYEYAYGSSGISVIGNYQEGGVPDAAMAGLTAIVAWVGRDLDPYGAADFFDAAQLPVIASHRDVLPTLCPGDFLYERIPELRDLVAATLASAAPGTGLARGLPVIVVNRDGDGVNLRTAPGLASAVAGTLRDGDTGVILDGPQDADGRAWWRVETTAGIGWVAADWLAVDGIAALATSRFAIGQRVAVAEDVNLRVDPGLGAAVIQVLPAGTDGTVIAGPVDADGFTWWQVETGAGTGWAVEDWLA